MINSDNKTDKEDTILICLPFAGGSVSYFNKWRNHFSEKITLRLYELTGRGTRCDEDHYPDIKTAAQDMFNKMEQDDVFANRYSLFGHSMGSIIAAELCILIRKYQKRNPIHVFFSGEGVPTDIPYRKKIHSLEKNAFIEELKLLGGISDEFFEYPDLQDFFIPILRNDLRISETALFEDIEPFPFNISVLTGRDDNWSVQDIFGWNKLTTGVCSIHYFNGGHFYIDHNIEKIISIIRATLFQKN